MRRNAADYLTNFCHSNTSFVIWIGIGSVSCDLQTRRFSFFYTVVHPWSLSLITEKHLKVINLRVFRAESFSLDGFLPRRFTLSFSQNSPNPLHHSSVKASIILVCIQGNFRYSMIADSCQKSTQGKPVISSFRGTDRGEGVKSPTSSCLLFSSSPPSPPRHLDILFLMDVT